MHDDDYWQAVLARDAAADGSFVYAVRSTGIYCRPACPARRPGRAQVRFFALPEAAEQAGFVACRRCRPRETAMHDPQVAPVQQICRYIAANLDRPLTLVVLGQEAGLSPAHLQRVFKRLLGISPHQYIAARRLARFKAEVRDGDGVTGALYTAGYGSSSRLYEQAPAQLGMTPATYRRGGAGLRIAYTMSACPLGRLLVAATERGLCAVQLGATDAALVAGLAAEYPAATLARDDAALGPPLDAILRHLRGEQPHLDLPLDVRATAFQWRVWAALQAIPYGSTRTYGEIAAALGRPGAARAVGQACAHNPVALVVPCHRAVRAAGDSGEYRWGRERKAALLDAERGRPPAAAAAPLDRAS